MCTVKNIETHSKSAARMAAVQALYQMEASGVGVERVILDFTEYWMTKNSNTEHPTIQDADVMTPPDLQNADKNLFKKLVRGIIDAQQRIDPYLERRLADGWSLNRLDATARAILRAGLFEIIRLPDTPVKVVLDEYINIAHAFFNEEEPRFINGVLNAAAHDARQDELAL